MAKIDLSDLKAIKLDEILSDLGEKASKRASGLIGDVGQPVKRGRRAIADPNDGDMFAAFILGLSVGALIGAALALVLTPVSGSEARRKITEKAEKLRGEGAPEWETAGASGNGRTHHSTAPGYGAGAIVS